MANAPFVFSSGNLPRLKAKQLNKAFPFLKLSFAQQATAQALGYASWFECSQRGTHGVPSPSDQDAGIPIRVARYYHQANVLIGIGITPADADRWVRAWGLTGHPTLSPDEALAMYYVWNDALERFERGEIDATQLTEECGDYYGYSKYPEIDRPQRVCQGVLLGPLGKYPHYAVDPAIQARIPVYLRGSSCMYHCEDDVDVLEVSIPTFPKRARSERFLPRFSRIQYEWHFGKKHPQAPDVCIPKLVAAALAQPEVMMVIAERMQPQPGGSDFYHKRYAVACLRGKDFAAFLLNKGVIDPLAVTWYSDVEHVDGYEWFHSLSDHGWDMEPESLPVFKGAGKYQPSLPVYSYPFMTAPMSQNEYGGVVEYVGLLPLNEDYAEEMPPDFEMPPNFDDFILKDKA